MRLFDLHCDALERETDEWFNIDRSPGHVDLQRGRAFSDWIQCFAVFVRDGLSQSEALQMWDHQCNTFHRWERDCPGFVPVGRFGSPDAVCHAILTAENTGALGDPETVLSCLVQAGVRMATLTWNGDNALAGGCMGTAGYGLTDAGRRTVREWERNGIVPDVSHLSRTTFFQLLRETSAPIVASHSNAYTVFPHPRNLTDDQFRAIRERGGIVGLNLYGPHLGDWSPETFVRHLEHFWSLDGEKTVCLGCDFDGMDCPPDWNGMDHLKTLYDYLQERGYGEEAVDGLFYQNAFRFFTKERNDIV